MSSIQLHPRYEIRPLQPHDLDWTTALACYCSVFHNKPFRVLYPHDLTKRTYKYFTSLRLLVQHQIESGYSLGVFDKEFSYKHPKSRESGGQLLWNSANNFASEEDLLEQMDFPLVACALAYDSILPPDSSMLKELTALRPMVPILYQQLNAMDRRDESWKATGPGQVLFRNGTSTRVDYEGKGLMKAMAHAMMHSAAESGFRGIQIESLSDAVTHVWSNPPQPFRGQVISEFELFDVEDENELGEKTYPFRPAKQRAAKIYCHLE